MPDVDADRLACVYGAALAASSGPEAAADVAGRVLAGADSAGDSALAVRAVRLAVRQAPARVFASMEPEDREAVALARLAGLPGDRVAAELGIAVSEVRKRMLRGLRALAAAQTVAVAKC
jgi:DNA-directed RNA polymerase specialized sigma24 family protein